MGLSIYTNLEDVYVANIETDRGIKEKVWFYDIQGVAVDFKDTAIPKHLLAAADGFLIVYSVDDWKSFQVAETIRKEIRRECEKKDVVVLVLGTKVDLTNSRQVTHYAVTQSPAVLRSHVIDK